MKHPAKPTTDHSASTARLTFSALCIALSIILGKFLSLTLGAFRISFENLPIILAAIMLGPIAGAIVGCASDLIGCFLVGYAINPFITIGAIAIGCTAGATYRFAKNNLVLAVYSAHLLGSIIIKSFGLHLYYAYPWPLLAYRIPLYLTIATLELFLLKAILKVLPKGRL